MAPLPALPDRPARLARALLVAADTVLGAVHPAVAVEAVLACLAALEGDVAATVATEAGRTSFSPLGIAGRTLAADPPALRAIAPEAARAIVLVRRAGCALPLANACELRWIPFFGRVLAGETVVAETGQSIRQLTCRRAGVGNTRS